MQEKQFSSFRFSHSLSALLKQTVIITYVRSVINFITHCVLSSFNLFCFLLFSMHTHANTYTQLHLHCVLFVCVLLSTQRCFCCASLFFVVVISGQRAQTFQQQHLNFVAHTHIAFASPLDAAQSRSTLASAALLFPLSKVTEAQPKTCTQFHTHTNTLRRFVYVS